ncbi:MAG: hypothetical protein ABI907_05030 [Ramlibacter sp.]
MEQPVFHVVLEDRKMGPYDRRTIVGMRIKKTLTSEHVLIDSSGEPLTVGDLIGRTARSNDFQPNRTGGLSIVQATYPASLVDVEGSGMDIPRFKDEVEVRVQGDVLRVAGRFRSGLGWKEDRVKIPLRDIVHARIAGSQVDLWLRGSDAPKGQPLQRIGLELFSHETAGELVEWLTHTTPWPDPVAPTKAAATPALPSHHLMWVSMAGIAAVIGVVMVVLLHRP